MNESALALYMRGDEDQIPGISPQQGERYDKAKWKPFKMWGRNSFISQYNAADNIMLFNRTQS